MVFFVFMLSHITHELPLLAIHLHEVQEKTGGDNEGATTFDGLWSHHLLHYPHPATLQGYILFSDCIFRKRIAIS